MMDRTEIIRLAKLAGCHFHDEVVTYRDAPVGNMLERFANLVAAEYKRDAERYRALRKSERFCVDENLGNGEWVPIHYSDLDLALDEETEKAK